MTGAGRCSARYPNHEATHGTMTEPSSNPNTSARTVTEAAISNTLDARITALSERCIHREPSSDAQLSLAGINRDVVRALLSGDLRGPMCRELVPRFRNLQQHGSLFWRARTPSHRTAIVACWRYCSVVCMTVELRMAAIRSNAWDGPPSGASSQRRAEARRCSKGQVLNHNPNGDRDGRRQ
jgi:hypothetical protein